VNQHAKYLGHGLFCPKVIIQTHIHTDTQTDFCHRPIKWLEKT